MLGLLDYKTISQYPVRVATMLSVQYTLEITLHWILAHLPLITPSRTIPFLSRLQLLHLRNKNAVE